LLPIVYHDMSSIVNIISVPELVSAHFSIERKTVREIAECPRA
jgi:hypothetical protein